MMRLVPMSDLRLQGWAASLLLHTAVVSAALFTVPDLTVFPEKEAFRWNVSIVATPAVQSGEPTRAASPKSSREPSASRPVPPVEPQVETIPTVPAPAEISPLVTPVPPAVGPQAAAQEPEQPAYEARAVSAAVIEPVREDATVEFKPAQEEAHPVIQEPGPVVPEASPVVAAVSTPEPSRTEVTTGPAQASSMPTPAIPLRPASGAEPRESATPSAPPVVASVPAGMAAHSRADYGWLAESIWRRISEIQRYPFQARLHHWEGRVVVRAVIRHDGHLTDLAVQESSGFQILDEEAMELIRRVCPLHLTRELGRHQVAVLVPVNYKLKD